MSSNNSSNRINVPEARQGMEQFKMRSANEVGVNLKNGYNGDLTSREASDLGKARWSRRFLPYKPGTANDRAGRLWAMFSRWHT